MNIPAVAAFIRHHFRHFNAGELVRAADAFRAHLDAGGGMMLAMAGAMSTARLGISLAEMIRRNKIQAICCTGANLEEDFFNLIARPSYLPVSDYRYLSASDEQALLARHQHRVTDVCIPLDAMRRAEAAVLEVWKEADATGGRLFPHEVLYRVLDGGRMAGSYQIDPAESWLLAACERNLPIFVPGWEDSTLGNAFAAHCIKGTIRHSHTVKTGIDVMIALVAWYREQSREQSMGFFQIGGGIAGDFPICVVPTIREDLGDSSVPVWGYFCQISDSTTSYGSYSGAVPNEKISWGKLTPTTPAFVIESDATIVAPLVFAYVLSD